MSVTIAELDARWDFSDPAASAARLAEAGRAAAEGRDGQPVDPVAAAEWATQEARALVLADRGAEARALLEAVAAGPVADTPVVATRLAFERGRLLNSGGDPVAARALFHRAADLSADDADLAFLHLDALHMLGIADPDAAEEWTARALALLSDITDPRTRRWGISLHNNIGWTRFDAGDLAGALTAFRAAAAWADEVGTEQQKTWAAEAIAEAEAALAADARD